MTGATGFLGHYVLRELLRRGRRVAVVLRPPMADSARRLTAMLARIGVDLEQGRRDGLLTLVEGGLPDGLPRPDWGATDTIINCAASLKLTTNGNGDPFVTNVGGAEAVIAWARAHGVKGIHAVSTAYTCGWNGGVIPERFHDPQPEFQTDYERSKWEAEKRFFAWGSEPGNVLTVHRPSFLIGDSETGYTSQFGGFYQLLKLVSVLKNLYQENGNGSSTYIPLRIPGKPQDAQNIVPVDWVARVMGEVIDNPVFHGRVYHLTNPHPPSNEIMKTSYEAYFGLHGGYFADPGEVVGHCSPAESLLWDQYHLLTERVVQHNPLFDLTHTREVMRAIGLDEPLLDRERLFKLFDYAAQSNFGRRNGNGFH